MRDAGLDPRLRAVNGVVEHFKNGTPRVSAHYIIGQDGLLVQMVPDAEKAWGKLVALYKGALQT